MLAILVASLLMEFVFSQTTEVKIDTNIHSPDIPITLLQADQYHFIPLGSFFQFSVTAWQFAISSAFLSSTSLHYSLTIASPAPVYNIIILNSNIASSSSTLNCYLRAVG